MRKRASITTLPVRIAADNFFRANLCNTHNLETATIISQSNTNDTSAYKNTNGGTYNYTYDAFDRRFVEGFVFNKGQLERVDFPGGYFDSDGEPHYLLTDRLGSVVLAVSADNKVEARYGYYPYGEQWRNTAGQQRRLASKERETFVVPGDYDFGPRSYRPGLTLWDNADRYASKFPWLSPFSYCGANPVKFIDPSGNQLLARDNTDGHKAFFWRFDGKTWGFFDSNNNRYAGNNRFLLDLEEVLRTLWRVPACRAFLSIFIEDPRIIQITYTEGLSYLDFKNPDYPKIRWNPEGARLPTTDGWKKDSRVDLLHELGHLYDFWTPKYKVSGEWFHLDTIDGETTITNSDKMAMHIENKMRKALDLPLRTCYTIDEATGEFLGPAIISNDGKNYRSIYFDSDENYYERYVPFCFFPYYY